MPTASRSTPPRPHSRRSSTLLRHAHPCRPRADARSTLPAGPDEHRRSLFSRRRHRHPGARASRSSSASSCIEPVIVENRAGANGTIGAAYVAKAPPDGLTMLLVPAGYAANPALYKSLPYDQAKDLLPVSILASGPLVLVVHPSLPAKSVKELIALAKAEPGEAQRRQRRHRLAAAPVRRALQRDRRRQAGVDSLQGRGTCAGRRARRTRARVLHEHPAEPADDQGRASSRALGVTSPQRVADRARHCRRSPHDLPGFDMTNWYGMLVPAGTPPETVHALSRALAARAQRSRTSSRRLYNEGMIGRRQHARALRRVSRRGDRQVQPHHRVRRHQELALDECRPRAGRDPASFDLHNEHTMTHPSEPRYDVLSPLSPQGRQAHRRCATRLPDLNGKTVCELWDVIFRGETIYPLVREYIRQRFPGVKFVELRRVRQLPRRARARGQPRRFPTSCARTRPTRSSSA